eukprot:8587877-Alexandrium_andersonii.AAC.1
MVAHVDRLIFPAGFRDYVFPRARVVLAPYAFVAQPRPFLRLCLLGHRSSRDLGLARRSRYTGVER